MGSDIENQKSRACTLKLFTTVITTVTKYAKVFAIFTTAVIVGLHKGPVIPTSQNFYTHNYYCNKVSQGVCQFDPSQLNN